MSLPGAGPEDTPFLLQVYGSVRSGELAAIDWTDSQKLNSARGSSRLTS